MGWFYINNAINWATFHRRGGWKSFWMLTLGYLSIAFLAIWANFHFARGSAEQRAAMQEITGMILAVQTIMLLAIASLRVSNIVRRDITTHQIESHRLMPLHPIAGILGYITGATPRILWLALINLIIGVPTSAIAGVSMETWLRSNGLIFGFAITLWCTAALMAFMARGAIWVGGGVVWFILSSNVGLSTLFPAMLVLILPLHIYSWMTLGRGPQLPTESLIISQAMQWILAATFIYAASRKYAHQNALAFPVPAALIVLAVWTSSSALGMEFNNRLSIFPIYGNSDAAQSMFAGSLASSLAIATFVIGSVAWTAVAKRPARSSLKRDVGVLLICLTICLITILALTYCRPHVITSNFHRASLKQQRLGNPGNWMTTITAEPVIVLNSVRAAVVISSGLFLLQAYCIMRILFARQRRSYVVLIAILAAIWLAPVGLDAVNYALLNGPNETRFGLGSPLGTIIAASQYDAKASWLGLVYQFVVLVGIICLVAALARARRRKAEMLLFVSSKELSKATF